MSESKIESSEGGGKSAFIVAGAESGGMRE
jgi:hypothetical protein